MRLGPLRNVVHPVVAALLTATTLTATLTTTPSITHASTKVEALMIGDSVLNGLAQPYSSASREALAARHSFILDSAGCRRLITNSCRIPPGSAPTNAITALRAGAGQYDKVLVMAAGYDDPSSGPFGVDASIDVIIDEARRQGIDRVIWLTYREAGGSGDVARFRQSNVVLHSRTDPELVIADWAGLSATLPPSWFSADGIHLGAQAAAAMADLIGDTLDRVVPARCTSEVWSGTDVPAGFVDSTSAVGGLNVLPAPVRALDTRELPGMLGAGRMMTVTIAGHHGVPADATAALVSVTAVEPCAVTFLTVFPCGTALPLASMLNANALSTVANSAVVRLGGGSLCVYSPQPTDVLVDVSGWIAPTGLSSTPVSPLRVVDTRPGQQQALPVAQGRLGAGEVLAVDISALAGPWHDSGNRQRHSGRTVGRRVPQRAPRSMCSTGVAADNVQPQRHRRPQCCRVRHGRIGRRRALRLHQHRQRCRGGSSGAARGDRRCSQRGCSPTNRRHSQHEPAATWRIVADRARLHRRSRDRQPDRGRSVGQRAPDPLPVRCCSADGVEPQRRRRSGRGQSRGRVDRRLDTVLCLQLRRTPTW